MPKSKDTIQIPLEMLEPIENYNAEEFAKVMLIMAEERVSLYKEKDKQYGGSWMKDGGLGAYLNLKRKIDRILTRFKRGTLFSWESDRTGEATLDTLMDLSNYSDMFMGLLFFKISSMQEFKMFTRLYPQLAEFYTFEDGRVALKTPTHNIDEKGD